MGTQNQYNTVTDSLITSLKEIAGANNVLTGDGLEDYSRDEMPKAKPVTPDVVVKAVDRDTVVKVLKLANENRIPVTPRGAGTGLSGGAVPIHHGIVLSLEKMKQILEIDRDNFVATVEPGVTLAEFYKAVDEYRLYYPPYPGETTATLGGNTATNAGGMRAVKYGVTRQSVLGLEAVLPTGEVIQAGGKFVKCSTGYDLTQLIIGSEGTLAVITKILLKLITAPGKRELLFIPFNSLHEAIRTVPDILKQGILPVGMEFMQKDIINMVEEFTGREIPLHDYNAFLLIIVEGDTEEEIYALSNRIGEICLGHGAVDIFIPTSEKAKKNLLEAREKFYSVLSHYGMIDIADVVVPRSRIADFVETAKKIASDYGVQLVAYGHAGDGNIHLHPVSQGVSWPEEKTKELMKKIFQAGISMGGTISGEHGLGYAKKGYLPLTMDSGKLELMKRIKRAFDPNNILNPGKVLDID